MNDVVLNDVLCIPGLATDLLLEDRFTNEGAEICFTRDYAEVYISDGTSVLIVPKIAKAKHVEYFLSDEVGGFPVNNYLRQFTEVRALPASVRVVEPKAVSQAEQSRRDLNLLWHGRMGHASAKNLSILLRVVDGVPKLSVMAGDFFQLRNLSQGEIKEVVAR